MSVEFCLDQNIRMADLFDGRLAQWGVSGDLEDGLQDRGILRHGKNWLCVEANDDGYVSLMSTRCDAGTILTAIRDACETRIYSEDDSQFWGFNSEEEMKAPRKADVVLRMDKSWHTTLVRYAAGEASGIAESAPEHDMAEIAKNLIAAARVLASIKKKDVLLNVVLDEYLRRAREKSVSVIVQFGPETDPALR